MNIIFSQTSYRNSFICMILYCEIHSSHRWQQTLPSWNISLRYRRFIKKTITCVLYNHFGHVYVSCPVGFTYTMQYLSSSCTRNLQFVEKRGWDEADHKSKNNLWSEDWSWAQRSFSLRLRWWRDAQGSRRCYGQLESEQPYLLATVGFSVG